MAPMLDPRDRIPGFWERHPRVASVLYQIGLCVMTFFLANTIDRTMERICLIGAREGEFELWIGDLYLCRFLDVVTPHFMAYPSTTTLTAAIILFLIGIIRLNYHTWDSVLWPLLIMGMFTPVIKTMEWKRFFASLQIHAPSHIWANSVVSALVNPILRWTFPRFYIRFAEMREEARRSMA